MINIRSAKQMCVLKNIPTNLKCDFRLAGILSLLMNISKNVKKRL